MKFSYTASMNKTELNALKDFTTNAAHHFGESFNGEELDTQVSQKLRVKFTAGNMLAFLSLKDTYEVSIDMEVDESYLVEYLSLVTRALPLIGGMLNIFKEMNALNNHKFEVLESELETE